MPKEIEKIIYSVINTHYKTCLYFEKDELFTIGWFAYRLATKSYDPTFGTKFTTYVYNYVKLYILRQIDRAGTRYKRENENLSLDYIIGDEADSMTLNDILADESIDLAESMINDYSFKLLIETTKNKIIAGTREGLKRDNLLELLNIYNYQITNDLSYKASDIYRKYYTGRFTNQRFYQIRAELKVYCKRALQEIKRKGLNNSIIKY